MDRIVFLDGISIAVQVIQKFRKVLGGMQVYPEKMKEHIRKNQYRVYGKYLVKSIFANWRAAPPLGKSVGIWRRLTGGP